MIPAVMPTYDRKDVAFGELPTGHRAIVPGKPGQSELVTRILSKDPKLMMPAFGSNLTLTDYERGVLRTYAEDVTKNVFATMELLNRNNSCFSDDKQRFDFKSLASITLDATAILRNFGGAWAVPIAVLAFWPFKNLSTKALALAT